jgi:hypothetical protein
MLLLAGKAQLPAVLRQWGESDAELNTMSKQRTIICSSRTTWVYKHRGRGGNLSYWGSGVAGAMLCFYTNLQGFGK